MNLLVTLLATIFALSMPPSGGVQPGHDLDTGGVATHVIAKADRPIAGVTGGGGRSLLVWTSTVHGRPLAAYRVMDGDRAVSQGLLRILGEGYNVAVSAVPGGFLVMSDGARAAFVSRSGGVWEVPVKVADVMPRVGDVPVGVDHAAVYRPAARRVVGRAAAPADSLVTHADGEGSWWALGGEEDGQRVAWSLGPGGGWVKHLVGPYSDSYGGCTCQWAPGVRGRGAVVVVATGDVQHVSTDGGSTWQTWDLRDTEPYLTTYTGLREPLTGALPDGRIVTGYMQMWVAKSAVNTDFRETTWGSRVVWRSGITDVPVKKGRSVSVDGGLSWLPLDVQPSRDQPAGEPSQHGTM